MNMKLYDITQETLALNELLDSMYMNEDGTQKDLTDEDREAARQLINEQEGKTEDKCEGMCKLITNLEAEAAACREERERLYAREKAALRKAADVKGIIEYNFTLAGIQKLKAGLFTLAIQKNPPSVFIARESEIPAEYFRIIPETREPDKKKMLEALKEGVEIPGALLSQRSSLRIR